MKFVGPSGRTPEIRSHRFRSLGVSLLMAVLVVGCSWMACAQTTTDGEKAPTPPPKPEAELIESSPGTARLKSLPHNIFLDQKNFWLTPFHMTQSQWRWTVPLTFVGAGLLASDTALEKHVPTSFKTVSHSATASDAGLAALVGVGGGMFLWGHLTHNEEKRETGLLSGEAAIDAFLDTSVIKYAVGRDRPFTGDGRGRFFQVGTSFPSQHAAMSWAIASVIAHEYPGPVTRLLAYGVAGGVSAARIAGQKHFVADAVVGSALGWYVGRQVFLAHSQYSDAEIAKWGTFRKTEEEDSDRALANMGSSYVPVDSWVYPAFDRLIASGYIADRAGTLRPWSRLECARLLSEVHQYLADPPESPDANMSALISDLDAEFERETKLRDGGTPNVNVELESVYSRYFGISGRSLRDSYHFAQTLANDFGRPYGNGPNTVSGFSANAAAGPFFLYVRGEYQYGSPGQEYTASQAEAVAGSDRLPVNSVPTFRTTSRLRPVEAYVGLNIDNWQLTFGQQSLWWGADRSTSLLLSNNAEAIPMLRVERTSPLRVPILGSVYVSGFLGRIGGYHYLRLGPDFKLFGDGIHAIDPQPYIWGANIAFKPTPNLELGFSLTTVFAGRGRPLNLKTFLHTFSQHGNFQPVEPGDRSPSISVSYRLPRLRNQVTVFADSMSETQPFPLFYPLESAVDAGIYLPHVPRLQNLDFRCEGIYTNIPGRNASNNSYFVNFHYADGNRNYGQLMTSWIGRGGNGGQASATYWFSGHNQATLTYRRMVSDQSLLKGGNVHDLSGGFTWRLRPHIEVAGSVQYEKWNFPLLNPGPRSNISTMIELRVWPKLRSAARASSTNVPDAHP